MSINYKTPVLALPYHFAEPEYDSWSGTDH
jgi:hypothetical protein